MIFMLNNLLSKLMNEDGTTRNPLKKDAYNNQSLLTHAERLEGCEIHREYDKEFLKHLLLIRACNRILENECPENSFSKFRKLLEEIESESQQKLGDLC